MISDEDVIMSETETNSASQNLKGKGKAVGGDSKYDVENLPW